MMFLYHETLMAGGFEGLTHLKVFIPSGVRSHPKVMPETRAREGCFTRWLSLEWGEDIDGWGLR